MFKIFRRSEPIQEITVVRADELHVEDRLVYDVKVEEVVALWRDAEMTHVILRPVHHISAAPLDEYHEEALYNEIKVQINRIHR